MNRQFLIYIFSLALISCSHSQTLSHKLAGNQKNDILLLLKEGNHTVDIMDGINQTPKQVEITTRLQSAIKENYLWFLDYIKTVPEGQTLPYHQKMGISKPEYEDFLKTVENTKVVSSGQESLTILKNGEMISFKGTGRLVIFDSVKIDLSKSMAIFRGYELSTFDSVRIADDKNGLESKWFGYTFSLEEPKDISPEALKDLATLTYTKFKLTIGELEKNKKTLLDFSGSKVENGEKIIEIRVPLVFE